MAEAFEAILAELPGLIPAMVQQESGGNPLAVSPKGARGLLQTMPMTEADPGFGVTPLDPSKDPTQERYRLGRDYMGAMLQRYGNVRNALAAYNWGPGNVDKWLKAGGDEGKLPKETQGYIRNILGEQSRNTLQTPTAAPGQAKVASGGSGLPSGVSGITGQSGESDFDRILAEVPQVTGDREPNPLNILAQLSEIKAPRIELAGDVLPFPSLGQGLSPEQLRALRELAAQHGLSDHQLKYLIAVAQQGR